MTAVVVNYIQRVRSRQVVRPWALCAPVVVLLIALPLLRPLRSPGDISENELSRLATIQSLVEHDTLVINDSPYFESLRQYDDRDDAPAGPDGPRVLAARAPGSPVPGTVYVANKYYSDQPPVMAYLLSWPYWVMYHLGWSFQHNPAVVVYLLTVLGVTLPVAGAAGLIYRMGRMFELWRPYRTGLALAVVLGSGLISYSTVLNQHAPAAALVLSACACLFHVTVARRPARTGAWLMTCGLCAATAAVIDVSAIFFLALLGLVVLAYRWKWSLRFGGLLLYLIGATPPLVLHAVLTVPVTGNLKPGFLHPELGGGRPGVATWIIPTAPPPAVEEGEEVARPSVWKVTAYRAIDRTLGALVGTKGLLTHFPVVIVGLAGLTLVLRRHWPASTKVMAGVTLAAGVAIVLGSVFLRIDWGQAMFGPRWFIVFLPLTLFWSGAWLRRPHRATTWAVAAILLAFSIGVALIGATAPFLRTQPGQYTVAAAVRKLVAGDAASRNVTGLEGLAGGQ
jgi:hypothetical protein